MPIKITKLRNGYIANVEHKYQRIFWKNTKPIPKSELIKKLLNIGCHQQDIGDAFYEADSNWLDE